MEGHPAPGRALTRAPRWAALVPLFERRNRGLLLDIVVLGANLAAMRPLTRSFLDVVRRSAAEDPGAVSVLFGYTALLFVLAPLGATLTRWHYHRRLGGRRPPDASEHLGGCLFNPIFYFCLAAVIFAAVNAFILRRVFGNRDPGGAIFTSSILIGLVLISLHTFLVYRYFTPPRRPPRSAFLRGTASEVIGDACLFANMLLFQVAWNLLSFGGLAPPGGVVEMVGRLMVFCFLALLIYFPPRMFYLAEDAGKPRTWAMILAANAPVIARLLLGSADGRGW